MEVYSTTCRSQACGHKRHWIGYKTGLGKTPEQLAQMKRDETACIICGGPADTTLDERGLVGAADAQRDKQQKREEVLSMLGKLCMLERDEVIDNALMLLAFAVAEVTKGKVIASVDETSKGYTDVEIPAFEKLKRDAPPTPSTH